MTYTAEKSNTCLKADVDVSWSGVQVGVNNSVLSMSVDTNGTYNTDATAYNILKTQHIDDSTLYDSLEVSFNTVDTTSMSKVNNVDMVASLSSTSSSSSACTTQELNDNDVIDDNALTDKTNT